MRGLYVHIPFCVRKCDYCDFYSVTASPEVRSRYLSALRKEAERYAGMSFQTMFFGGGTPSVLGTDLAALIRDLGEVFDLSEVQEATVEVNPESATQAFLESVRDAGINRISIGVQSLNDSELQSVGRLHTAAQAIETVRRVKEAGFDSFSADIIVGLPEQTWLTLHRTLETLLRSGVEHVSMYCLSLEEGTPLGDDPSADIPSDDTQAELFRFANDVLTNHGYRHYEISNFAIEGHECEHNLIYWRGEEYLGLGPAAASHLNGRRFRNRADLVGYLDDPAGQTEDIEELPPEEKAAEEAMLRLRLVEEGLDIDRLAAKYGAEVTRPLADRLLHMAEQGKLHRNGPVYRLPTSRILTSNPVFAEVLGTSAE